MTVIFTGGDFFILFEIAEKKPRQKYSCNEKFPLFREGGGRRRGGNIPCNSLAVAMNVPCLLISALYSVCWREGKRREE